MPLIVVVRRPRCRDFTRDVRRETRASVTPLTHRPWRRSSPSCAPPATAHGRRLRALIVVLWRAGLRITEALVLGQADLDHRRGALLVRCSKGGRRREVGMDEWAWEQLEPWTALRLELPVGPLFCVINGPTRGRPWSSAAARADLRRTAAAAGVRRRFAPHQLRHAHAVEMAHEGVPLIVTHRQLGHSNLGITSIYLQGIDNAEIIDRVHGRHAPMVPVSASLRP
jgi:site-specific recombinase XerD